MVYATQIHEVLQRQCPFGSSTDPEGMVQAVVSEYMRLYAHPNSTADDSYDVDGKPQQGIRSEVANIHVMPLYQLPPERIARYKVVLSNLGWR